MVFSLLQYSVLQRQSILSAPYQMDDVMFNANRKFFSVDISGKLFLIFRIY